MEFQMRKRLLIAIIVVLLVIIQLTRFEDRLEISYDGANITGSMGTEAFKFNYSNADFDKVATRLQKSVKGETGIRQLFISGDGEIFSFSRPVFYLLGKDVFSTMVRGNYKVAKASFGDWSLDNSISYNVVLYNQTLPERFNISAVFVGRGYKSLKFLGRRNLTFEVYDGLLGNKFCISRGRSEFTHCICPGAECSLAFNDDTEPVSWNILRILNLFSEIALVSLLIILFVALLSRRR